MRADKGVPDIPPHWYTLPPADEATLAQLVATAPVGLPESYLAFLRHSDGGEGEVCGRYLSLWSARDVHLRNDDYDIYRYLPGVIAMGTDGGDDAYLFDGRAGNSDPPVLAVELGSLALGFKAVRIVAETFAALMGSH